MPPRKLKPEPDPAPPRGAAWPPSRWSVIRKARDRNHPEHREAIETLTDLYTKPILRHMIRNGIKADDAEDCLQAFILHIVEGSVLKHFTREGARFRTFIKIVLERFLVSEYRRETALKRGGGRIVLTGNIRRTAEELEVEPATHLTPDALFDQGWAISVIEEAQQRLRKDFVKNDRVDQFDALMAVFVLQESDARERLEKELNMTPVQARNFLYNCRRRLRAHISRIVHESVDPDVDLETEVQLLLEALNPSRPR